MNSIFIRRCTICGADIKVGDTCYVMDNYDVAANKRVVKYVCMTCGDLMGSHHGYLDELKKGE